MSGSRIDSLNNGVCPFKESLIADALAATRVEVAIVTLASSPAVVQDFVNLGQFNPPTLGANGTTAMGGGVELALDHLTTRKADYRSNGIPYYRPWIFLITDGSPTESIDEVRRRIAEGEAKRSFSFLSIGVEEADIATRSTLSSRAPLRLEGLDFGHLTAWIGPTAMIKMEAQLEFNGQVARPPPTSGEI